MWKVKAGAEDAYAWGTGSDIDMNPSPQQAPGPALDWAPANQVPTQASGQTPNQVTDAATHDTSGTVRWRCANCSRPLASAYAVCAHCEPEFTPVSPHRVAARSQVPPLHHCPTCGEGFDAPATRWAPDPAPWWRWQYLVWCCPQCRVRLDWQAEPAQARVTTWASVGFLSGWGAAMLGVNMARDWPAPMKVVCYGLALAGAGAYVWGVKLRRSGRPQAQGEGWQVREADAARWAHGRFALHGETGPKPDQVWWGRMGSSPWHVWLVLGVALALLLAGTWWRKHSELPHHATGPVWLLGAVVLISWVAVWRAWRLRRVRFRW